MSERKSDSSSPQALISFRKKKIKKWGKRILLFVGIGVLLWFFFGRPDAPIEYVTEKPKIGLVRQTVEVNGTVESDMKMNLVFQKNGKIAAIPVSVGEKVHQGDILAVLDPGILGIEVERAAAALQMAQAELDLRYAGPANEDIAISKTQIEEAQLELTHTFKRLQDTKQANAKQLERAQQEQKNAEIDVQNAKIALENIKGSGGITQIKAGKELLDNLEETKKITLSSLDTIRNALFLAKSIINPDGDAEKRRLVYIGFDNQQEKITALNTYKQIKSEFMILENQYYHEEQTWNQSSADTILGSLEERILETKKLTDMIFGLLSSSITGVNLTASEISTLKSEVNIQQNNLILQLDALRDARQYIQDADIGIENSDITTTTQEDAALANLDTAKNILALSQENIKNIKTQNKTAVNSIKREIETKKLMIKKAKESYNKLIAKPRHVDVASLQANVQQTMASWKQAQKNIEDTLIIAPVDGIITDINGDPGENVTTVQNVITLMTPGLQMKVNVPETDVTKIAVGDSVETTLDAFPQDKIFTGHVLSIDPAETVIQGVVYYQATVSFDGDNEGIRSGMTSDINILSAEKTDALSISPEAIRYEGLQPFVFVLNNGEQIKTDVVLGLEGDDAVEILSGIGETDRIVLYEKSKD